MAGTSTIPTEDFELVALRQRLGELEEELALLVEASSVLPVSRTPAEVLDIIIDLARRFINADAYAVWRKRNENGAWVLASSHGLSEQFVKESSLSSTFWSGLPAEPTCFEDVERDELLLCRRPALRAEGIRSMLAIPLRVPGEGSGTVVFYWRTQRGFTAAETRSAAGFGALAAAALSTAELVERRSAELEMVTDSVPALMSYVDTEQRYRRVNRAYEEFFGLNREHILGKTVAEMVGREAMTS
jgi:GAF domain-containing protein